MPIFELVKYTLITLELVNYKLLYMEGCMVENLYHPMLNQVLYSFKNKIIKWIIKDEPFQKKNQPSKDAHNINITMLIVKFSV
jgi:hypothetical protein